MIVSNNYEEFLNENNKVVDTGQIIFANLNYRTLIYNCTNMNIKIQSIISMKMEKYKKNFNENPLMVQDCPHHTEKENILY